jgi:hypothetical protein
MTPEEAKNVKAAIKSLEDLLETKMQKAALYEKMINELLQFITGFMVAAAEDNPALLEEPNYLYCKEMVKKLGNQFA